MTPRRLATSSQYYCGTANLLQLGLLFYNSVIQNHASWLPHHQLKQVPKPLMHMACSGHLRVKPASDFIFSLNDCSTVFSLINKKFDLSKPMYSLCARRRAKALRRCQSLTWRGRWVSFQWSDLKSVLMLTTHCKRCLVQNMSRNASHDPSTVEPSPGQPSPGETSQSHRAWP